MFRLKILAKNLLDEKVLLLQSWSQEIQKYSLTFLEKKVFRFVVVLADLIKDRRCHFSQFCGMRTSLTI